MDKSQKDYAKWKNPNTKDYILYDLIYMKFQKMQNYSNRKQISGSRGGDGSGGKGLTVKGHKVTLWDDRHVLYHDCGDGYMTLDICQHSLNCIIEVSEFHYM